MAKVKANPKWQVNGIAEAGYYAYFYEEGTSTPKDTYTDYTEGAANTNPVILDARGEADVWFSGAYKVAVYTGDKDTDGVLVWTVDNYGKGEDITASTGSFNLAQNGSFESDSILSGEPDSWTIVDYTDGSHSIDATTQFYGLNSLKFTSAGTGGGYATSEFFEVQEGRYLATQFAIQSTVATVRNVVDLIWYTAAQTLISTTNAYDDSTTNPTTWTFKKSLDIVPSTARYAKIRIYGCHSSDATVGSTWFDNIVVSPLLGTMGEQDSDAVDITGGDINVDVLLTNPVTTSGTASAYTAILGESAYVIDRVYTVKIHADNVGVCTLDLDSNGTKDIKLISGRDPFNYSLKAGMVAKFLYNGTDLILLNPIVIDLSSISSNLLYLGDESDGVGPSTTTSLSSGEYHYSSWSISTGQTIDISDASGYLVIRCTGTVTLVNTATISTDGKGGSGGAEGNAVNGTAGSNGVLGGSGGSGGNDGNTTGAGGDVVVRGLTLSGGANRSDAGAGASGVSLAAATRLIRAINSYGDDLLGLYGGGGGGGGTSVGAGDAGAGGNGGGFVIIIADTIDFQTDASISCDGANGTNSANDGGGGGGGGGFVLLAAKTITNNGTITVIGGTGGTGISSYNGGNGGAGYSTVITIL